MLNLIPAVKELKINDGYLSTRAIFFDKSAVTPRLAKALEKLPVENGGAKLSIDFKEGDGEGYELKILCDSIEIIADSEAGVFYAIQTLRQIFDAKEIPCLYIKDYPDFKYRGFYQDISRGKIATVATLKSIIDKMASYKMNAFQVYVEHVYEFEECRELHAMTSSITGEELRELDAYCRDNFIDFQPSLSTFGHMFEVLNVEKLRHLRVLRGYENNVSRWHDRHSHHTIDPENPESIELIDSLIGQFAPNFTSDYFNVCCDETFDLKSSFPEEKEKALYIEFVSKILSLVKKRNKKPMMWADILVEHPEAIDALPEDTLFLNWCYVPDPTEDKIAVFSKSGRTQIVCPSTNSWLRFCEIVEREESNIITLAEYGYKYGALGMLTTNWGDWGHLASLESSIYGLVLGAAKSWAIDTKATDKFHEQVNERFYHNPRALEYLTEIGRLQNHINHQNILRAAEHHKHGIEYETPISKETIELAQSVYCELYPKIASEDWTHEDFKDEQLLSLEGMTVLAELGGKLAGLSFERVTDTEKFLKKFAEKWLKKNKPSELWRIEEVLRYMESI